MSGSALNRILAATEAGLTLSDVTTDDVSTSKHGFAPKAPNDATKYLDGTGAYSVPSGLLVVKSYAPVGDGNIGTVASSTLGDFDATNAAVTFTAPASGKVIVRLQGLCASSNLSPTISWGLRESTTIVAGPVILNGAQSTAGVRYSATFYLTGISAGSHTYKWAGAANTNGIVLQGGPNYGPIIMEVWAA